MRGSRIPALGLAALLGLLMGCTNPVAGSAEVDPDADLVVLSEEQAEADAASTIDSSNADEVFLRLKAEIEGDR